MTTAPTEQTGQATATAPKSGPAGSEAGERYTVRQKIWKLLGNAFHIYGEHGELVGYCKQKAFKLREDFRFFTDESQSQELFSMRARQIIDWSATYDIEMPGGERLGALRRKGFSSIVRDEWKVFGPDGEQEIGRIIEDSQGMALVRRFVPFGNLVPQTFHVERGDGTTVAIFRGHFNPFVYRLGVRILVEDEHFDDLLLLGSAVLLAAIEGRQDNNG